MTIKFSEKGIYIFIEILRSVIRQEEMLFPKDYEQFEAEVLLLAKHQEMMHLLYFVYKKQKRLLPEELEVGFLQQVHRDKNNQFLLNKTKECLRNAQIRYVPLKGSVLKELYPEPWMRSGCDIDVLVQEHMLDEAVRVLVDNGFATDYEQEFHDVALYYGGALLELHYNVCENIPRLDRVLSGVWKNVVQLEGYEYRENPEFLAFHTIAHLLYHFVKGGSNIKAFMDLWLMRNHKVYNEKKLQTLLKRCRLERFYKQICEAIDIWFGENEATTDSLRLERQVLSGGLTGYLHHTEQADILLSGGATKYLWSSLFLPYSEMQWIYPRLKKKAWLLPYYYCKRLFTKVVGHDQKKTRKQLNEAIHFKDEDNIEIVELMTKLGLD